MRAYVRLVDMGIDIEQHLNKLICKYNIDRHMPGFRQFLNAKRLITLFYDCLSEQYEDIVLAGVQQTAVTWFQKNICKNTAKECIIDSSHTVSYEKTEESCYLIVSYDCKDELRVRLLETGNYVISIYDFFESQQLYFEHDFFDVYDLIYHDFRTKEITKDFKDFDINEVFFWHRRNYEIEQDRDRRRVYLEKIIFDCVYAKDFLLLKFYIDKYNEENENCSDYKIFGQEVDKLLEWIILFLKKRNQKDCLMIWLDALEYGDDENMSFLHGLDEKSLVFDNIYTVTPYTRATFKTLFGGIRVIEEKSFKISQLSENTSEFFKDLAKRGYSFKYYGGYGYTFLERKYQPNYYYSIYTPMTQIFFDILCDMVSQKKNEKSFFVLHEDLQTHIPYISLGLKGTDYIHHEVWAGQQEENEKILQNRQALESREYVDKQLEFWNNILPESMYKIYMSDHGHTFFGRFHPIMKICQKEMTIRHCTSLLSYCDFGEIMLYILDHNDLDDKQFDSENVIVQDVDYYNKDYLLEIVKREDFSPDTLFGYQGVITKKDMLLLYRNGIEYYQKNRNDGMLVTDERLVYLRSLLSKSQINIYEEEQFKYSRIVWEAEKRCTERTLEKESQKKKVVNNLFERVPIDNIIAIRGGGIHTLRLMMLLDSSQRQRISYIIDKNESCLAGKMGIKVLKLDEFQNTKIDYIIVSSYDFGKQWKNELVHLDYDNVVEIYEELENAGIFCTKEFYKKDFIKEDFVYEER